MRALRYALDEALTSLWRGRQAGVVSIATIAVALLVLGGFLLVTSNLERLASEWSRAAEMSVYVSDDITPAQKGAVEQLISSGHAVAGYEFVSKADALKRFKETFSDLASTIDSLGENPLPASYEVRLSTAPHDSADVEALGAKLKQAAGVSDVRYDREWLDRLLGAVSVVRTIGLVLGIVLTAAAALTVANVVRLALYSRRDELDIMHLVGAPTAYVRGPFVMEGVLQGGIGALLALAVLAAAFLVLRSRYLAAVAAALNFSSVRFLPLGICASLLAGGMIVGCLGGLVAAIGAAPRVTQS